MKKNDWKSLIDALLFVDLCSLAVVGLLLAFFIPSGKVPEASKFFLGIHRHQWGDVHLYVSLFMLGLIVLHIWFNWTWVVNSTKGYFGARWKKALWSLTGVWLVVLFLAWAIVKL
jgi:hypothetical protein